MIGHEARRRREDALATGIIAGITVLTAIGRRSSSDYDAAWFRALRTPRWEPSGAVIGPVWAVLYAWAGLSASLPWRKRDTHDARTLIGLFALQYLLNYAFTQLLTLRRSLSLSTVDSGVAPGRERDCHPGLAGAARGCPPDTAIQRLDALHDAAQLARVDPQPDVAR